MCTCVDCGNKVNEINFSEDDEDDGDYESDLPDESIGISDVEEDDGKIHSDYFISRQCCPLFQTLKLKKTPEHQWRRL